MKRRENKLNLKIKKHAYHAGTNIHTICAICDLQKVPVNILTDDWEMANGPGQLTSKIYFQLIRYVIMSSMREVFPNLMASVDEAKKTRIQFL